MEINWFTFIAQIINFLVLVWLLNKFLYKPVLKAIDEREKKINSKLENANLKEAEAQKGKDEFIKKNDLFESEKKELWNQFIEDSNKQKELLIDNAKKEAEEHRNNLEKALIELKDKLKQDITLKAQQEVLAIARMTIKSLSSLSLEEQTVTVFIKKLKGLLPDEKLNLLNTLKSGTNQIVIKSAFELSQEQKTEIEHAVNEIFEKEMQFQFITNTELICGIKLITNGYKLSWNISEFFKSFEKSILATNL